MRIVILGGTGSAGRDLARALLSLGDHDITLTGRDPARAAAAAGDLRSDFPGREIGACAADATDRASLDAGFAGADLVIVTAMVPDFMAVVAEAAVAAGADIVDIHVRADVIDRLAPLGAAAAAAGRVIVTQAGVHPGLPGPLLRHAARDIDGPKSGEVLMAMNARMGSPEAGREILHGLSDYRARVLQNRVWRDVGWLEGSWRAVITRDLGDGIGAKSFVPIEMPEIERLDRLGFTDLGAYVAGFNWFVDYLVFPAAMLADRIRPGLGERTFSRALAWGIDRFSPGPEWILFRAEVRGAGGARTVEVRSDDPYGMTALALVALVRQLSEGALPPGLHLMGEAVSPPRLLADLGEMGVELRETAF